VPGHEAVGRIIAFGEGTPRVDSVGTPLAKGDRVIWEHESCGHCYGCTVLHNGNLCAHRRIGTTINANKAPHFHGNLAQYTYVWPRSGRIRVPEDVKSSWASAASCALRTVVNGMDTLGAIDFNDTVVIQGAGPLGLFATAIAATHSPRKLIVIGAPEERLAVARSFGADLTISVEEHADPEERVALVKEATSGRGGDVVCEFSGGQGAFGEGVALAAPAGRYVVVGSVFGPAQPVVASQVVNKNLRILGSVSAEIGSFYKGLEFLRLQRSRFDWDSMLSTTRYRLDDALLAYERMQRFEETKAVFQLIDA
jgi:threonine dehydrogenase-like Zn-dependent dehydrogenase